MSDPTPVGENPFAPPLAESPAPDRPASALVGPLDDDEDFWQYESLLLVRRGTRMPDRCVVCNAASASKRVVFHLRQRMSPWLTIALILVLGPLFLLIAVMCLQTAQLSPGLCAQHRRREVRGRRATLGLLALGISLPFAHLLLHELLPNVDVDWFFILGPLGLLIILATLVFAALRPRPLRAKKIDEEFVWLERIPPEYIKAFHQATADA